jgi:hypothetical protein
MVTQLAVEDQTLKVMIDHSRVTHLQAAYSTLLDTTPSATTVSWWWGLKVGADPDRKPAPQV